MEKKLHLESNCERIVASKTLKNSKNKKKSKIFDIGPVKIGVLLKTCV